MTATATLIEKTEEAKSHDLTHKHVCAYLKGFIVGKAKRRGMKWNGDEERTPEFKQGWEDSKYKGPDMLTFAHIIYNWLRHDRHHLGTEERDEEFVKNFRMNPCNGSNKLLSTLAEFGLDVDEVLR